MRQQEADPVDPTFPPPRSGNNSPSRVPKVQRSSMRDSVRSLLGGEEEDSWSLKEYCPSLSYKQRIIAFFVCAGIGLVLSCLAVLFIFQPAPFAVLYTFGNICGLCATLFLVGPMKQVKKMCDPVRLVATVVFLAAMGLTLWAALGLENVGLVILFVIIQFCALFWYTISFIPGARNCVKRGCSSAVGV